MSFRQFGGKTYSAKNNIISNNYASSNNLTITENIGQTNSHINSLSNLDISGSVTATYMFLSSGNNYSTESNAVMPKSYIDSMVGMSGTVGPTGPTGTAGTQGSTGPTGMQGPTGAEYWLPDGSNIYYSKGNVGIGNNNPTTLLDVTGNIKCNSITTMSDYRTKKDIKSFSLDEFSVDNLNPVYFKFINNNEESIGLIAHELQEHYPFLVTGVKNGEEIQTVNYSGLIGVLIKEIQQLKKEIKLLKRNKIEL